MVTAVVNSLTFVSKASAHVLKAKPLLSKLALLGAWDLYFHPGRMSTLKTVLKIKSITDLSVFPSLVVKAEKLHADVTKQIVAVNECTKQEKKVHVVALKLLKNKVDFGGSAVDAAKYLSGVGTLKFAAHLGSSILRLSGVLRLMSASLGLVLEVVCLSEKWSKADGCGKKLLVISVVKQIGNVTQALLGVGLSVYLGPHSGLATLVLGSSENIMEFLSWLTVLSSNSASGLP